MRKLLFMITWVSLLLACGPKQSTESNEGETVSAQNETPWMDTLQLASLLEEDTALMQRLKNLPCDCSTLREKHYTGQAHVHQDEEFTLSNGIKLGTLVVTDQTGSSSHVVRCYLPYLYREGADLMRCDHIKRYYPMFCFQNVWVAFAVVHEPPRQAHPDLCP